MWGVGMCVKFISCKQGRVAGLRPCSVTFLHLYDLGTKQSFRLKVIVKYLLELPRSLIDLILADDAVTPAAKSLEDLVKALN